MYGRVIGALPYSISLHLFRSDNVYCYRHLDMFLSTTIYVMYKALCEYKCVEECFHPYCRIVSVMLPRSRVRVPRLPRFAARTRDQPSSDCPLYWTLTRSGERATPTLHSTPLRLHSCRPSPRLLRLRDAVRLLYSLRSATPGGRPGKLCKIPD